MIRRPVTAVMGTGQKSGLRSRETTMIAS